MRSNNKVLVLALGTALAAVCTGACKKSSETEKREADQAAVRAAEKTNDGRKEAIDQRNDYLAAVRREQLDLRSRLQEELDDIDKKLADLKTEFHKDGGYQVDPRSKDAAKIRALLQRRSVLESDVNLVERSDERGWDETKANIERDLGGKTRGKI
jgi:hypothetical protein